jgi:hypothetical protein
MFGKKFSYTIKVLQGEQLEGYTSLHDFYSELIPLANPESEI